MTPRSMTPRAVTPRSVTPQVMAPRDGELGQVTVMIIGFVVLLGLLLVVVVNASSAYLAHRSLVSAADGAATAAVSGLDRAAIYRGGLDASDSAPLSIADARSAVREYLRTVDVDVDDVAVQIVHRRVRVRLATVVRAQFAPPGWPGASRVVAESTARLDVAGR